MLRRLALWDRVLLVGGLGLVGLTLGLGVTTLLTGSGGQQPPFHVGIPADGPPVIDDVAHPEFAPVQEARVGDRLLRVGAADVREARSALLVLLHGLAEADDEGRLPLRVERDGRELEVEVRTLPFLGWRFVILGALLVLTGALALVGGGGSPASRWFFLACLGLAVHVSAFHGGSLLRSGAAVAAYVLGACLAAPCWVHTLLQFPAETARRGALARWGPWIFLPAGLAYASFSYGWPLPLPIGQPLAMAFNVVLGGTLVGLLVAGYRRATPRGRRELRWVGLGLGVAIAAIAGASLLILLRPELVSVLVVADVFLLALPLGFLFAIVAFNAFDVDRVITATTTWGATFVLLLLAVAGLGPLLGAWLGGSTSLPPDAAHVGVALAAGLAIGPSHRWLRPRVEALFFPERLRFWSAVSQLERELGDCHDRGETAALLGEQLALLLGAVRCEVYDVEGEALALVFASGTAEEGAASLSAFQLRSLGEAGRVRSFEEGGADTGLAAEERSSLRKAGVAALVPVRRGDELALLVCLGPKRSGDVYTPTDLRQLQAVAERAGVALLRIHNTELNRSSAMEREANVAKSRFLAAASHDLRQPLHALGLFVGALADRVREPELAPLVSRVERSTESLEALFDGVLDVSKLDAGVVTPRPRDFVLGELFERLREELLPQAQAKGLLLRVAPTAFAVHSDPLLLGRVLRNLLVNAVRYTEAGAVMLCARRRGAGVALEVRDSGPGLSDEETRTIFGEFRRLDAGRRASEGLGLGLSIVDRLTRLLGHRLVVRSAPGRGSVFTVVVARASGVAAEGPPEPAASRELMAGRRIVVVDDDPDIREGLQVLLEGWGCTVIACDSLATLEARLRSAAPPDVLLTDDGLGGGATAPDAVAALRAACGRGVPALVITGDTSPERLAELEAAGLPVLSKPLSPARLRALLARTLRA